MPSLIEMRYKAIRWGGGPLTVGRLSPILDKSLVDILDLR